MRRSAAVHMHRVRSLPWCRFERPVMLPEKPNLLKTSFPFFASDKVRIAILLGLLRGVEALAG